MRRELFKLFYHSEKYSLNDMSDANEALENVLNLLHAHIVKVPFVRNQLTRLTSVRIRSRQSLAVQPALYMSASTFL